MADLYRDYVYAKTTANVISTDTTIAVDDVSLFPSNALLAKSDFWLVFESALTYPPTFEVVKLTYVNTGTKVLTIARGQGGTTAVGHSTSTYVKGALTSDMLRRARGGFSGSSVPAADSDLFITGDRFTHTATGRSYIYDASNGFVPQLGLAARATATSTSSSVSSGASDSALSITLAYGYRLYSIATDYPARVTLYSTAAARTADFARPVGTDPDGDDGVVLDFVTTVGGTVYSLSPLVDGSNLESSPSKSIPMRVTNMSDSTRTITVTLVYVATE